MGIMNYVRRQEPQTAAPDYGGRIPGKDEIRRAASESGLKPVKTRAECEERHAAYHWRNRPHARNFECLVCGRSRSVNSK